MPPCVVRPVGPPARAGEHSKPSCLQARAVRARRSDVLGVGGAPSPKRPKNCPRARAFPGYSYWGGCHPPALSSYSLVAPVVPASGCRGPPAIYPSIHPCIHSGLPLVHSSPRPLSSCQSLMYSCPSPCRARHAPIFVMHAHMPCAIRWRSPCDARFAHPLNRGRCDASNGIPCPTQVAGAGHARGPAAQWWWAHGGPAGVIGGKNCTNGK